MSIEQQAIATLQLILAALLSMIIGMDRERLNKSAGLRTHMLAGIGACLFTSLSHLAFPEGEQARVASSVVEGIGFLGAGTIIQRNNRAHDLTTAASIWSTAAVGMAVGSGAWFLALSGTIIVWIILVVIRKWEEEKSEPEDNSALSAPD